MKLHIFWTKFIYLSFNAAYCLLFILSLSLTLSYQESQKFSPFLVSETFNGSSLEFTKLSLISIDFHSLKRGVRPVFFAIYWIIFLFKDLLMFVHSFKNGLLLSFFNNKDWYNSGINRTKDEGWTDIILADAL